MPRETDREGALTERNVVLGVTGSIAAYKALDLASKLTQADVTVHTIMTKSATKLVGPASFRAITGRPVSTDLFELTNPFSIEHISLAEVADLFVVAPATANVIAKIANGIADDLLTCTALATRARILIAPAMHTAMWENPATQASVATLRGRGVQFAGPAEGRLASGCFGAGRFAPVDEVLSEILARLGASGDLAGRRIIITAGGTREPIDPVRFLGNRSSGKMGFALAEAARDRGADVLLIVGPTQVPVPGGVRTVRVVTAADMLAAVQDACGNADALIMAAAVADFAPARSATEKIKKSEADLVLRLERTADILASIEGPAVRVGFAAETEGLIENARKKLHSKRLDLIVANAVGEANPVFGSDENQAVLITAEAEEELPRLTKRDLADRILDRIALRLDRD